MRTRIALVPGVLALLPEYAAQVDPVPELRAACLAAVAWLGPAPEIVADDQGERVARALLAELRHDSAGFRDDSAGFRDDSAGFRDDSAGFRDDSAWLVVANGTARRTQMSPGPYDDRAVPFDEVLGRALSTPDPAALGDLDQELARELWASTTALPRLAELLSGTETPTVDYEGAPHGVQYWVVRYERCQE